MTLMTEGKTLVGGEGEEGAAPQAAMPQIEKERSWAKPKQLPAGPKKKRPLGRLFSSFNLKCRPRSWHQTGDAAPLPMVTRSLVNCLPGITITILTITTY